MPLASGTMCIRFDTKEQIDATIKMLDPATRFPFDQAREYGELDSLIGIEGESLKSLELVNTLWKKGLRINRYEIVDGLTLIVEFIADYLRYSTLTDFSVLSFDATNISERYYQTKSTRREMLYNKLGSFPYLMGLMVVWAWGTDWVG